MGPARGAERRDVRHEKRERGPAPTARGEARLLDQIVPNVRSEWRGPKGSFRAPAFEPWASRVGAEVLLGCLRSPRGRRPSPAVVTTRAAPSVSRREPADLPGSRGRGRPGRRRQSIHPGRARSPRLEPTIFGWWNSWCVSMSPCRSTPTPPTASRAGGARLNRESWEGSPWGFCDNQEICDKCPGCQEAWAGAQLIGVGSQLKLTV